MTARPGSAVLIAALGLLAGCVDATPDVTTVTSGVSVSDSAGVEIIESSAPAWAEGEGWTVDPDPILQIGAVDGAEPYQFTRTHHATRLDDGSVVVVEGFTREIRVFGPDGEHRHSFGRPGEGPGEFTARPEVAFVPPDTLLTWDRSSMRTSRFLLDGTLLEETPLRGWFSSEGIAGIGRNDSWKLRPDGILVVEDAPIPFLAPGGTTQGYMVPYLISLDGPSVVRMDSLPHTRWIGLQRESGALIHGSDLYAPEARVGAGAGPYPLLIGDPERWEIRHYDAVGRLGRIVRAAVPPQPLTPAVRADARERFAASVSNLVLASESDWAADQFDRRDTLPPLASIHSSRSGHLWVERRRVVPREGARIFDVVDPAGRWLGPVSVPDELGLITEFGPDWIVAWWADEFDVLYVRVYGVEGGGI